MLKLISMQSTIRAWAVRFFLLSIASFAFAAHGFAQQPSEEAYKYFEANCQSCHTIGGGRLAGPDLKGLLERRERAWLQNFLINPKAVIDSGDAYAQEIFREARGVYMPTPPGITRELADKLLDVIAIESPKEKSRFAGLQISDRPLTAADTEMGRRLFFGQAAFASGAPACNSCHDLDGSKGFGGGQLGPDLTAAFARLEGRKAVAAWLSAPPSPVMAPIFRKTPIEGEEALALTAFLQETSASGLERAESSIPHFLLAGFGLGALVLVLFDLFWRDRYRATRRPMIERRLGRGRLLEE